MKCLTIFGVVLSMLSVLCDAQEIQVHTKDIFVVRAGEQLQTPHILTYRVFEWEHMRGRWIAPDLGYYDSGYGQDQVWIAGGGAVLTDKSRIELEQEIYLSQEAGSQSQNRRSLWLWSELNLQLSRRLSAQVAVYPTIPLDQAQRWGYDIDRAKIEWRTNQHWIVGAGYNAGICNKRTWQNRPFLTVTRNSSVGNVEMWLQSVPGGAQLQLRYMLVRTEH